jgi:hypothetical protein
MSEFNLNKYPNFSVAVYKHSVREWYDTLTQSSERIGEIWGVEIDNDRKTVKTDFDRVGLDLPDDYRWGLMITPEMKIIFYFHTEEDAILAKMML